MSAPRSRLIDQFTGRKAPDKFFQALRDADESLSLNQDCDTLRDERDEALMRVQELEEVVRRQAQQIIQLQCEKAALQ